MRKMCALLPLCWFAASAYAEGGHWELGTGVLGYSYSTLTTNWDTSSMYPAGQTDVNEVQNFSTMNPIIDFQYMNDKWGFEFQKVSTDNRVSGYYAVMPNLYGQLDFSYTQSRARDKSISVVTSDVKTFDWLVGVGARYYKHQEAGIMDAGALLEYTRDYSATFNAAAGTDTSENSKIIDLKLHANYYKGIMDHLYVGGGLALTTILNSKSANTESTQSASVNGSGTSKGYGIEVEIVGVRITF